MRHRGNFLDQLPAGLVDMLLAEDGDVVPVYQPDKWKDKPEYDEARIAIERAGYHELDYRFHQYTIETPCMKEFLNGGDLDVSFALDGRTFTNMHWWFIKLNPGDMQPMHFDPHVIDTTECLRQTMMLTDFEDGHIFVYEDYLLNNYVAGDLFEWPDPMILHGVANISHHPRISLQLSFYNK